MSALTKTQLVLPETEIIEQKIAKLNLTGAPSPLKLGGSLNGFKKIDLTPLIGTEFARGIQLRELLKAPHADELLRDLAIIVSQRGVVFFREQGITSDEQKVLAAKLGELTGKPESSKLHVHPITAAASELSDDEIFAITSERRKFDKTVHPDRTKFGSKEWHTDVSYEPVPSDYAILKLHTVPDTGGDTLWASGYEAYDRLSPSFAKYLETLEAIHEGRYFQRVAESANVGLRDGERGSPGNVGSHLEAVHPVVRTNPVTGWKSVYVNETFTKRIGVTKDESDIILRYLFNLVAYNHDLQVRFKWEKNSVAIWDNRSNYHAATHDHGLKRVGERVTSLGEKPYFDPKSMSRRESFGLEKK